MHSSTQWLKSQEDWHFLKCSGKRYITYILFLIFNVSWVPSGQYKPWQIVPEDQGVIFISNDCSFLKTISTLFFHDENYFLKLWLSSSWCFPSVDLQLHDICISARFNFIETFKSRNFPHWYIFAYTLTICTKMNTDRQGWF